MDGSQVNSMIVVDDLHIETPDGLPLVDGVSFNVAQGGTLGLVGESGSGKSLTSLALIKLLPSQLQVTGRVQVKGREVTALSEDQMRSMRGREIGMVFQDPFVSLNPVFTIRHQIYDVVKAHATARLSAEQLRRKAEAALDDVGLSDPARFLDRYPFQLSGGQAQRVAIALALIADPDVLIADEPTTALDVTVQDGILRLLERLRETRQLTLVFISHDLAVVARLCDQLCIMQHGRIVESGATDAIVRAPSTAYTKLLLDSVADFSTLAARQPTDREQP